MRQYMEDYTPKSPRLRKIYNMVAPHAPTGNLEWRDALAEGGERRAYALMDVVLRAVHIMRPEFPALNEEDLYSIGLEVVKPSLASTERNSRSSYVHGSLLRGMRKAASESIPVVRIESLEDALERGDGIVDESRWGRVIASVDAERFVNGVRRLLETLSFREREVLKFKYGLGDGYEYTLEEIGRIFKASRVRIHQIEIGGLCKLQLPGRREVLDGLTRGYAPSEFFSDGTPALVLALNRYEIIAEVLARKEKEEKAEVKAKAALSVVEEKLGKKRAQVLARLFRGNPLGFIDYVRKELEIMPDVRSIRSVMMLSAEEKAQFPKEKPNMHPVERVFSVDPYAKKALAELSPAERVRYQEAVYDRVVESVLPLFVGDPSGTLQRLQKLEKKGGKGLISQVREHLEGVRDVVVPNVKTPLRLYQKADVLFMNHNPHTLHANPMGLGKSLDLLASFAYRGEERMLIIAPTSAAVGVWPQEITKHFAEPPRTVVLRGKMSPNDVKSACEKGGIVIATHYVLNRSLEALAGQHFDVIAVDESHMLSNPDSERYKSLARLHAPRKVLLSGTPFKNSRSELWAPLRWLAPERFDMSQEDFARTYMRPEGVFTLAYDLRSIMIRRSKSKMLPDLPALHERVHEVDFKKQEREEYTVMERSFLKWWREETGGTLTGTQTLKSMIFKKMHALRQYAIRPKLRVIPALVQEAKARGEKVVIATTYRDAAEQIRDLLPRTQVCYIDGSVRGEARARAVADFESKLSKKVMVITEAGSQSLNLTAANNLFEVNDPWTWADRQQRVDREHRLGQERQVNVVTLMTKRSVDGPIRALILDKKDEFEAVFDAPERFLAYRSKELRDMHEMLVRMAK